jgi:geranylgeranyl pyrophosphate synthase
MPEFWPTSVEVHVAVAERVSRLLDEYGGPIAHFGRSIMGEGSGVLSERAHSLTTVLVPGACLSAGGQWRDALWPATAAECMMAAADLFDDVADADSGSQTESAGVLLTAAAGLLSLATVAVARSVQDGSSATTATALAELLGRGFAHAANGQAVSLQSDHTGLDALGAYRQSAAKSGPLGALIAKLGARTGTDDAEVVDLLGQFGHRLAVRSQLLNDVRDASPDPTQVKADVRTGAPTVPLVFSGSIGAPAGLSAAQLDAWEMEERVRIAAGGGLAAALALAEAERLQALQTLDTLETLGHSVVGLRALI